MVKFLRHTKPDKDGWIAATDVIDSLDDVQGTRQLAWLIKHSISEGRGARILAQYKKGNMFVRAAPKYGAPRAHVDTRTPWETGARLDAHGLRIRGPRTDEARQRRNAHAAKRAGRR